MTRGEQIKQVQLSVYGNCTCRAAEHFGAGAQWADNNPADETIQRIVMLYKEWYTTESTACMVDFIKIHLEELCN